MDANIFWLETFIRTLGINQVDHATRLMAMKQLGLIKKKWATLKNLEAASKSQTDLEIECIELRDLYLAEKAKNENATLKAKKGKTKNEQTTTTESSTS